MQTFKLYDRGSDEPIDNVVYSSRVVASECRMELAAKRAGWDMLGKPDPETRRRFFEENDKIEIR